MSPEPCPTSSFPSTTFQMPTSKLSIRQRDTSLRSQLSRELTLATLKDPRSWDSIWRPLLLIHIILKQFPHIESLHDHPYIWEQWRTPRETGEFDMKLLLTNEDGSSMVLVGTNVSDTEDEFDKSVAWREVSLQLQRFFRDCMNLFEGIRMRSVVVSPWDEGVKSAFAKGEIELARSWRVGNAFTF